MNEMEILHGMTVKKSSNSPLYIAKNEIILLSKKVLILSSVDEREIVPLKTKMC